FCGSALFYTPLSHVIFIQQAKQNFAGTFYASLVQKIIPFGYISYVFLADSDLSLVSLALYQLLGYFVAIAVALPFSEKRDFKFSSSDSYVVDLFNFGKFTLGTNICSMVNKNIGEWIIGGVLGVGAVAIYNPAMRISSLVEIPLSTTAQIMYPELIKRLKKQGVKGISLLYQKSIGVVVLCIFPMVVLSWLYADEIVVFVAGEQYRESAGLLKIAMLGGLFLPFVRQFGVLLNAMGKMNWNFYFMLSVTIVSGVLSYFMISVMGLDGAVYSYLIISFLAAVVTFIVLKFSLGIDFVKSFRSVR
ncbi:oligosaccharide flippase family protein, partial [Flavobacteriales bacterium]|nr:oligosaccharide flippase family protein [Flavobacteriales bacterium]